MPHDQESLIRDYAAGRVSWHMLKERGIGSYLDVLATLGALGLRPPRAPLDIQAPALAAIRKILDVAVR